MRINQIFYFLFFFPLSAFAIQWEIVGQDSKVPVHRGTRTVDLSKSAGEITLQILQVNHIPFVGSSGGLVSILGTPYGDAATVIISNDSMRVYGWCFEVDGVQPSVMPDKVYFSTQESKLSWFFAFSLYEKGEWKSYCVPAYLQPLK